MRDHDLFIEKPLVTDTNESTRVLQAIECAGIDAVIGYTQRFRRRFLAVKEKLITGQVGDMHSVVTRVFMNHMVPIATVQRTQAQRRFAEEDDRICAEQLRADGVELIDLSDAEREAFVSATRDEVAKTRDAFSADLAALFDREIARAAGAHGR